ncbi:Uncharacterised protein (plasmid) [Tsukamurella tyrosinosolvens]|uniref:Uncharacterized protein n=1 Tax=Tsukamurella tyrosinosolvens TaxID=57704 RepID=A0A1H4UKS9_TSUTY|nr:hypothetical protein [Tsukamurella tyrosinosolvens]KXO99053.1 hypothetical protein AXK58_24165 [Tsukamurella tyrosinosolvens]SEC69230.1 hypothetical protein SAMN04489793_2935 [Tsukamurella tyrosinosolvens]VEH94312.1 Uncharacterised protein [Tsukamurella tyrosinosolvens]
MLNTRIEGHPLVGTTHVFRADQPPYDPAADQDSDGTLLIAPGFTAEVSAVFKDWNGIPGLDMLYVHCPETGESTHITPADLGLPALD